MRAPQRRPGEWRSRAGRSGLLSDAATPGGESAVGAFSTAPASGYSVAVAFPRDRFDASGRLDLIRTILIGLVLLAFGAIASACLVRRLVGALHTVGNGNASPSGPA